MENQVKSIIVVDGVEYLSPNEATAALIEGGASPLGAYQRLMRLAQVGVVRTLSLGTRARLYRRDDVLAAGDGSLRDKEHAGLSEEGLRRKRNRA